MKKKVYALTLILALLFFLADGIFVINQTSANIVPLRPLPEIVINTDGNITPETDFINRKGDIYTLTTDIEGYAMRIEHSNIVLDGAGHKLYSPAPDAGYLHSNDGLTLTGVRNVTVKNLEVSGVSLSTGISLRYCSNCLLSGIKTINYYQNGERTTSQVMIMGDFNQITESNININVWEGSNNLFTKNNVHKLYVTSYSSNNRFYQNNFFLQDLPGIMQSNFWDNGSVGNYWNNYSIRYPNALEIGNTGIADMPYIIERAKAPGLNNPLATNIDNFPLMYTWGIPELAVLGDENATYLQGYPLNFTVDKPARWMGYSLNGDVNVTVTGNMTISGLASGLYKLTVYTIDVYGVGGASKSVYFTVVESFPTALITGVSAVLVVGVAVCLFYHRKKHNSQ